jgi:allantoinase
VVAETEAITRAIHLAQDAGCRLHLVHVSSIEGVVAIRMNRTYVTCETCPHYLTLTEEDVIRIGAPAKCAPPIRSSFDRSQLIDATRDGSIDIIASDHSPSPASMKTDNNFFRIWGGIAGVQSTLPLLLKVEPNIRLEKIAALTSQNVSAIYNLPGKGNLKKGFDADLCIVDLARASTLAPEHLLQRHKISPYIGMKIQGMIQRTILRGRTIFLDGKIVGSPGGRFVRPERA